MYGFRYDPIPQTRAPNKLTRGAVDEYGRIIVSPQTSEDVVAGTSVGWAFDVVQIPLVTAGAYAAGEIMGGLLTFPDVARAIDEPFIFTGIQVALKTAGVKPSLLFVTFDADPTSTVKTDNEAYSLNVADAFKVQASLPGITLGGYWTDHGTPDTFRLPIPSGGLIMSPVSGTRDMMMLMVDLTGVTLGGTHDVQVRVTGMGP